MCFPRWHGTDEDGTLFLEHYSRLNSHGLFDSAAHATDFLRFYTSFDWTETGDYSIVSVWGPSDELRTHSTQAVRFGIVGDNNRRLLLTDVLTGMTWNLQLRSLSDNNKIVGIKALRDITDMGLAETKNLVETLPKTLVVVYIAEIEQLKAMLSNAGFEVEITAYSPHGEK
jgi:hypothetical protein